jgi:hypothetical protein
MCEKCSAHPAKYGPQGLSQWCHQCVVELDEETFKTMIAKKTLAMYFDRNSCEILANFLRGLPLEMEFSTKVIQVMQEFQLDKEETLEFSRQTRAWDQEELDKGMPFQKRINV